MEDVTQPDSEHCERSASERDVKRICRTSVEVAPAEHESLSTGVERRQAPASVLSCTGDVVDVTGDSSRATSASGNPSSESTEMCPTSVSNSENVPSLASAGSSQPEESSTPVTSGLETTKELITSSEEARDLPGLASLSQLSEQSQEQRQDLDVPASVTSSQDSVKACTSSSDKPAASSSSSDEIAESLQCVICQEILYNCVRSVSHTVVVI